MNTGRTGGTLIEIVRGHHVERALDRLRSNDLATAATVDELLAVATGAVVADPELATLTLDLVEQLAPAVGADHALPASHYLRARSALNRGDAEEALALIERANLGWRDLGRPLDAVRTELGRMHVLDDLGRHAEAAAAARSLLDDLAVIATDEEELDAEQRDQLAWMQAAANENLGVASGFTGHHAEALAAYERAEEIYRSVGGLDDLARCRANRGVELVAIGRAVEGLDALLSAGAMFTEADNRLSFAQCIGHAAEAELLLGLYAASLERFREAGELLDGLGAVTEATRLRLRNVQAYLMLNLVDEAAATAGEVIPVLAEAGLAHDLAEANWMAGIAAERGGRTAEAIGLLDAAVAGADTVDDPALGARAELSRSEALVAADRRADAVAAAEHALTKLAEGSWPVEEVHTRLWLAQLVDDRVAVEGHLDRATELVDELALPQLRYPLLIELGRRDRQRGDTDTARSRLLEAIDILEGLRGLIPDEILRSNYLEGRTTAHVELISMLIDGSDEERRTAFDLAEASKSRTLDDIMAGAMPARSTVSADDPTLARYEADLHAAYSALTSVSPDQTRSQRQALQDRAVELERAIRLAHLRAETGGTDAPVTDRSTSEARGPSHQTGRRRPGANEQVVEYHVVADRIIAFVWCAGRLEVVELPEGARRVDELVGEWERSRQRYELARGLGAAAAGNLIASSNDALRALWVALFGPLVSLLDAGDLLVVPHGALHVIPFHALIGPEGPVGEHRTVTVAPSYAIATHLPDASGESAVGRVGRSVVVGVPDESAPAVADEARQTADILPGAELLLGSDATVENLLAATTEPVDVLHLACHGLHRPRNPMFSALKLFDRWLTAQDVLAMSLPGALVVLSACESGRQQPGQHVLRRQPTIEQLESREHRIPG
ncbi:MAG: CHAT domain-containing protein, partial [Actinomycetota bacterium]